MEACATSPGEHADAPLGNLVPTQQSGADSLLEEQACEEAELAQGLAELGLTGDFTRSLRELAEEHPQREAAQCAAAELDDRFASLTQGVQVSGSLAASSAQAEQSSRQQLAREAYQEKVLNRPKSTSAAYTLGQRHFVAWCQANNRSVQLTDATSELYARFVCKEELLGPAPGRPTSFKYAAGRLLALRDLRLQQLSQGLYSEKEVSNPWSLTTVSLYMSAKYNSEKKVLCNAALSAYLKKQMSHAQLCTAMRLALDHQSHHWAVTLRLSLTWMAASARRSIDARLMTYRSMCVQETRQATAQEPWVGVSPCSSKALCFVAGDGKTLPSGHCEASGAVRFLDVTLCPVSACADLLVMELTPARLRLEHLGKAYILRAPSALGHNLLSASTFIKQIGLLLRAAGVKCDLSEKPGASGKPTVTHQLKKYAVALAALVGVDYDKIAHLASHERNVTRNHYMTTCADAMHRVAGFGPDWQHAHVLGRAVPLPDGLAALVCEGLGPLASGVAATHPDHMLLPTLEAALWLIDCYVQDMPLKLLAHGQAWARLFAREVALLLAQPAWWPWAQQVVQQDLRSKNTALANMRFKGNPVDTITRIFKECQRQAAGEPICAPIPSADKLLTERQRKGVLQFSLAGLETCEQAVALFKIVDSSPIKRWAGDSKNERNSHCTKFCYFRDGLFREYLQRQQVVGEVAALASLEEERRQLKRARNHSELQKLANFYRKKHKLAQA